MPKDLISYMAEMADNTLRATQELGLDITAIDLGPTAYAEYSAAVAEKQRGRQSTPGWPVMLQFMRCPVRLTDEEGVFLRLKLPLRRVWEVVE